MSIKDLKKYYAQVEQQYFEMNQTAKELNEECAKGNVPQSMVDQAEAMTLPLRQNYERLSYVMYLLNKPNKQSKTSWYRKQNQHVQTYLKNVRATEEDCYAENADVLKNFKAHIAHIKEKL